MLRGDSGWYNYRLENTNSSVWLSKFSVHDAGCVGVWLMTVLLWQHFHY